MQKRIGRPTLGEKAIAQRTIGLTPEQWKQVDAFERKMGYDSTGMALRRIVSEWWELRGRRLVDTGELTLIDMEDGVAVTP